MRVTFDGNDWDDGADWDEPAAAGLRGTARIGGRCIDGGGSGTLAYNQFPGNGSNMVMDTANTWTGDVGLRNTVGHEAGHGLGLRHVCPLNQAVLMEPNITTSFDGPQHDDIRAGQRLYGDPNEGDNSSGAATPLGVITATTTALVGTGADFPAPAVANGSVLSIDNDGEDDWFSFTTLGEAVMRARVRPVGLNYEMDTQQDDGDCNSGTFINSLNFQDLRVALYDTDGTSQLILADANGFGGNESTGTQMLPAADTYFVRVDEADQSGSQSQLYDLQIEVNHVPTAVCQPASGETGGAPECCATINAVDLDGGSTDPDGVADIVTRCITMVDGMQVACADSVEICDPAGTMPGTNPHPIELTVIDSAGNSDSCETTATVVDTTDPVAVATILTPQPAVVDDNCEVTIDYSIVITDNCCIDAATTVLDVILSDDAQVDSATLGPTNIVQDTPDQATLTGTINVQGLSGCPGRVSVRANVQDCSGNEATSNGAESIIQDETPPMITCPEDITLDRGDKLCRRCIGGANAGDPCEDGGDCESGVCLNPVEDWLNGTTATDNCSPPEMIEIVNDHEDGGFTCGFPYDSTNTITWRATDECGNSSECTSTITIGEAPRTDASVKGSLLVYPKVELRWDANGNLTQDTFISLTNDFEADVNVQLYFVNGDAATNAVTVGSPPTVVEPAHNGWNRVDCQVGLTADESTHFSVLTGQPAGCQPFTVLDPGTPPGRPDPEAIDGSRMLRGFILAWAVNQDGEEIRWNHLTGLGTIVDHAIGDAWEYRPYAFSSRCGVNGAEPADCTMFDDNDVCCTAEVIPGNLDLDAFQYDLSVDRLLLDFFASGSEAFSSDRIVTQDTDITLLPLEIDLRQDGAGPFSTKAKFDIWNQNETRFSGTERCIRCWDQVLLSSFASPNHFLISNLQTNKGKARIDGISSGVVCDELATDQVGRRLCRDANGLFGPCGVDGFTERICVDNIGRFAPCSDNASLLGLTAKHLNFATGDRARAGSSMVGQGYQRGRVQNDIIDPDQEINQAGE